MTTETATMPVHRDPRVSSLQAWLESPAMLRQIKLALRTEVDPLTIARIAMTTAQRNPKLLSCTPQSFAGAIIAACQLGLEPDNVSGLAYLVPFKDQVVLIPGYRGLIALAYRSGQISTFETHNVYAAEEYVVDFGNTPPIRHKPSPPSQRGEYVGSYAKVTMKDGGVYYEWMWAEEIDAIRERSKAKDSGPWVTDTDEMRRKTVAKRACKYIPSSPQLQRAVSLGDQADANLDQSFIDIARASEPADGKSRTQRLGETLGKQVEPKRRHGRPRKTEAAPNGEAQSSPPPKSAEQRTKEQDNIARLRGLVDARERVKRGYNAMGLPEATAFLSNVKLKVIADVDAIDDAEQLRQIEEALP